MISSTPAESLLDDDKLIETLKGSKVKSNQIKKQMEDQKKLMEKSMRTFNQLEIGVVS